MGSGTEHCYAGGADARGPWIPVEDSAGRHGLASLFQHRPVFLENQTCVRVLRGIAAAIAIVVMVMVAGAATFMRTAAFSRLLKGWVDGYLSANFVGEISVGGIEVPILGGLVLHDVIIAEGAQEVATVPQITIRYWLMPILWHAVQVEIEVESPQFHLLEDSNGQWNLAKALASKSPPSPSHYSVHLTRVLLRHGFIDMERADAPAAQYVLSEINVTGSATISAEAVSAEAAIQSCRIQAPKLPVAVISGRITYEVGAQGTAIVARSISLATKKSAIEASGSAEEFGAKGLEAKVTIRRLAREDLLAVVPSLPLRESDLNGEIDLNGRRDDLRADVGLSLSQAHIAGHAAVHLDRQPFTYDVDTRLENFDAAALTVMSNSLRGASTVRSRGAEPGATSRSSTVSQRCKHVTCQLWDSVLERSKRICMRPMAL